ncbi:MAG: type III pantothenate kinase [Spirochaetes bacterium]|nr:type III pantothenate kinase [Spirochaetota bacterium]
MFLGIDIGNTSTVIGLYDDDSVIPQNINRYKTDKKCNITKLINTMSMSLKNVGDYNVISSEITGIAFSSVVPEVNSMYHNLGMKLFNVEPFEIRYDSDFPIGINYRDIKKLGIDRIVNSVAAHHEYGNGCIVIDAGTAVTIDVLNFDGFFDGGIISPGIGTMIKALAASASNLPVIPFEKPDDLIALDTENALKSGFYYGWISLIEGLVQRIEKIYNKEFKIILTGGFAEKIFQEFERKIILDSLLTMKGIKYIYHNRYNSKRLKLKKDFIK